MTQNWPVKDLLILDIFILLQVAINDERGQWVILSANILSWGRNLLLIFLSITIYLSISKKALKKIIRFFFFVFWRL